MSQIDTRKFRKQLEQEFPEFELQDWFKQYRQLKAEQPDAILLYRLGDFYETFEDDAKLIADKLGVTLTHRGFATPKQSKDKRGEQQRCAMAGMPYHAIERYANELVAAGYRVAVAEQTSMTDSSKSDTRRKSVFAAGLPAGESGGKMVERTIVRVLTPGTVVDGGMLNASRNNYLAALIAEKGRVGLAYADLSTGEFFCTEFQGERAAQQAQGELTRLSVAEVIVPDDAALRLPGLDPASARLAHDLAFMTKAEREMLLPGERVARKAEGENTARWAHGHITAFAAWRWEARTARDALMQQLGVQTLAGFGIADKLLATRAAGAIIQYTHETQHNAAAHITTIRTYTTADTMFLDPQTRRNLELLEGSDGKAKGSLISVLDQTRTPMGARLLRRWLGQPLLDRAQLEARHEAVAHFFDAALPRAEIREALKPVGDIERAVNRVVQGVTIATPRDLVRLREALRALPNITRALNGWLPPSGEHRAGDREQGTGDSFADLQSPISNLQSPISNLQSPISNLPSLRAQRETRKKIAPRYDDDDLFGEGDWDDEPVVAVRSQEDEESSQESGVRSHESEVQSPARESDAGADRAPTPDPRPVNPGLDDCADILAYLEQALDSDPPALLGTSNYLRSDESDQPARRVIRPGFSREIEEVVRASRDAQAWIDQLETRERAATGLKSLKVGYNDVFHYYIEVSRADKDNVPSHYAEKQTLVGSKRFITLELKEYQTIVLAAKERIQELERTTFAQICAVVAEAGGRMLTTARVLAEADVYAALAEVAVRRRYVRPTLTDDTTLRIVGGRHPVVEQALDEEFVPNDTLLDTDTHAILIVTGPNMAGKSTVMRQIALIVLLAQIGSFVPAQQAEIGLVDRIFTRIGAQDDIATGQSTFMVEMTETAALLLQSTRRSLIVLDEVGRGTSTYDGMAIARAVIEYIHNEPRLGCRTLFATHYHELTALEELLPRVKNYHMAAVEQDAQVVFLHELRRGGADRSYGIHVAALAGIPRVVVRRANELLAELEGKERRQGTGDRGQGTGDRRPELAPEQDQLALFGQAPHPMIEMIKRLNVNELSPIEALTKLYELQRLARM